MLSPPSKKPDIILITADSLRADQLGCYAGGKEGASLTPELDRLASRSGLFTHAFSQGPYTGASLPAVLPGGIPAICSRCLPVRPSIGRTAQE